MDIYVQLLWHHLERHENVVVQNNLLHCGQGGMSSWSMTNKRLVNFFFKVPKMCPVPGTGKISSPQSPKG